MHPEPNSPQGELYDRAEAALPGAGLGGYALPKDVRFIIREGHGGRLVSMEGRQYVDYVCGAGATIIGHDHPAVVEAVRERVSKGMHFFGTLNDAAIELAETLVETIPCAERVIFTTTGSEATAYAMRIARAVTGRPKILKFEGAYHGNHDYAAFSQFPTGPANYPQATADVGGVPRSLQDTMLVAPYNSLETVESILAEHAGEIAAIIVEPVQRIIFPQPGFLQGLRALADRFGVLLVFDEVVTGFRLSLGGAQGYFGVEPDLATYGKIVGGGGPLGCVAGKEELLDATNPARKGRPDYAYINGTLHGNPIAAVAGLATLRVLQEPGFYEQFHARADRFRAAFSEVLERHDLPAFVAGEASFWQILFSERAPANQMDVLKTGLPRSLQLDLGLLRNGVYVLPNVRRFFSAAHDEEDLERTLEALDASCAALA
ncbi:aspartate aminotransferase family protein [Geminicoccaceae bacterium 1502E]|nr:aspartate aminotransferase family protein [Geminicoccaceae bacterium 1502E]